MVATCVYNRLYIDMKTVSNSSMHFVICFPGRFNPRPFLVGLWLEKAEMGQFFL